MKKIYFMVAVLMGVSTANAQIWQDDFSDPANWAVSNTAGGFDWVIGTNPASGSFPLAEIVSTTAANGYAMFDSDLNCIDPGALGDQTAMLTTANAITKAAGVGVVVQFEQNYNQWQGQCFVEVSADGITWVSQEVNAGGATANPEVTRVSFADAAISAATSVYLQFKYLGACDYAWYVDDVQMEEQPALDLKFNEAHHTYSIDNDYTESSTDLTQIPYSHAPSMHFWGTSTNMGSQDRNNCTMNVDVTTPSGNATVVGTMTVDIPAGGVDSVVWAGDAPPNDAGNYHPTEKGTYTFTMYNTSDETEAITGNDTIIKTVMLSDSTYAKDDGNMNSTSNRLMWYQRSGTVYEMAADGNLSSVSVGIQTRTESVGNILQMELWIYDVNDEANPDTYGWVKVVPSPFANSGEVVITAGDLGKLLTFPMETPRAVTKGERFMVAINQPTLRYDLTAGAYADGVWCIASGETDYSSRVMHFIQWNGDGTADQADGALYRNDYPAPMIRMNFGSIVGVKESIAHKMELGQNVPNPFNNSTRINYVINDHLSSVQLEVVDVMGKRVALVNEGSRNAGKYSIELNSGNLANGVYYYTLIGDGQRLTKRMIITE